MIDMDKIDKKDIFDMQDLGDGFIIFRNKNGYFLGVLCQDELAMVHEIDSLAYKTIARSNGGRKKK